MILLIFSTLKAQKIVFTLAKFAGANGVKEFPGAILQFFSCIEHPVMKVYYNAYYLTRLRVWAASLASDSVVLYSMLTRLHGFRDEGQVMWKPQAIG